MSGAVRPTMLPGHVTTNGEMKLTEGTSVFCSGEMGNLWIMHNIKITCEKRESCVRDATMIVSFDLSNGVKLVLQCCCLYRSI